MSSIPEEQAIGVTLLERLDNYTDKFKLPKVDGIEEPFRVIELTKRIPTRTEITIIKTAGDLYWLNRYAIYKGDNREEALDWPKHGRDYIEI